VPEGTEDTPLAELSIVLQKSFAGTLGKRTKSLLEKFFMTKMPSGYGQPKIRSILHDAYGFGPGRQCSVMLWALRVPPLTRLETEAEATSFWSNIVSAYASENHLDLGSISPGVGAVDVTIDLKVVDALSKRSDNFHREIHAAYGRHLSQDSNQHAAEIARLKHEARNMQDELDIWKLEHGTDYGEGVKPAFDERKVRSYDSSWNWALQDIFQIYHSIRRDALGSKSCSVVQQRHRIVNCTSERLITVLMHMTRDRDKRSKLGRETKVWLNGLLRDCQTALQRAPNYIADSQTTAPRTIIDSQGLVRFVETATSINGAQSSTKAPETTLRSPRVSCEAFRHDRATAQSLKAREIYYPAILQKPQGSWIESKALITQYVKTLDQILSTGLSFQGRNVLVTGAGKSSIGVNIVQALLSGGARVIVTSSSYATSTKFYQHMFTKFGAAGSNLMVVPFNAGSSQDADALVKYIYSLPDADWDLDHIIPFAAISDSAHGIELGPKSELAHRLMLTNVLRLLGAVKKAKEARNILTRPAQVILPLSPNHGMLGGDGLYPESKLGLEAILNKWRSEDWSNYLSVCGAVIGWTRGTGLMSDNNMVAEGIEALGVRTFSPTEMAMYIVCLMSGPVLQANQMEPLIADMSGGMGHVVNLKDEIVAIRQSITDTSSLRRAQTKEHAVIDGFLPSPRPTLFGTLEERANIKVGLPNYNGFDLSASHLGMLEGMIDLEKVVVIVGFGEVGPHGSSRTRWQRESAGRLALEGVIEMAWTMGLIEYQAAEGSEYIGWIEKDTKRPIEDREVKQKYEEHVLNHSGIRVLDARALDGPDPAARQILHEMDLQHDFAPFEVSKETAADLLREHGSKITVSLGAEEDTCVVTLHKGARLMVPKSLSFDRTVGGQVPTGWSAKAYGITEEIINQVDPATLYALVCTAETLLSAGVTDAYEFYKHIHVSQLGVCVGSGFGGATSLQGIYKERYEDKQVQSDVLAESFVNTGSAWINMLLLGSCGTNITPVGACATALESLDVGVETIMSGKAKAVLVGGYDYLAKAVSYEFANMKATINSDEDFKAGRQPHEMSRPATSSRAGFVESEGCGTQLLTTASLAMEMGLPIYGIVALTRTAFDGVGRSLPAPGRGTISFSGVSKQSHGSPLLDMRYRKRMIERSLIHIAENEQSELEYLEKKLTASIPDSVDLKDSAYRQHLVDVIKNETKKERSDILSRYGNEFWKRDTTISSIQGALAVWGLTVDDISVASCHGTSTVKNELNECTVIQDQMTQLGRAKGNPLLAVFQKHLTGHPKGAAAAWMLNGALQIMETGLIPGNRNADNIDPALEKFDHIVFPNETIHSSAGVDATLVNAFGFGQKGAQAIIVHPKHLFAAAGKEAYASYSEKFRKRKMKADQHLVKAMITNSMFRAKNEAPYKKENEMEWLMNLDARLPMDMTL